MNSASSAERTPVRDMAAFYSWALDEVFRLRCLLEYEADVREADLSVKTFPKSRRKIAEEAIERMRECLAGNSEDVYRGVYDDSVGFRRMTGRRTFTRHAWEQACLHRYVPSWEGADDAS